MSATPLRRDLIGNDDLENPYWVAVDESAAMARASQVLLAAPRVMAVVGRRAWRIAPRLVLLAVSLELLKGAATTFGLLATADVFSRLLAEGPTPERLLAALPHLVAVVAALAAGSLLESGTQLVQAVLKPRIEQHAQNEFHAAIAHVDLVAFDDADSTLLVQRGGGLGMNRMSNAAADAARLLGSFVSVVAAMTTAALLDPLLAPVVLLSVVPQAWASVRTAKISYRSMLDMSSRMRRLGITGNMITSRWDAAEVRAFTAQDVLVAEHERINAGLTADTVRLQFRTTRITLAGRALAGLGTGASYAVLGVLLYTGRLPLALSATALLALRAAASEVSSSVYAANRLYEAKFYIDLYDLCLADAAARTRPGTGELSAGGPSTITLDAVSFTYPGQDEPALHEVDLELRAGQTVALVGENGSGKTTLAKLITGLYLPTGGTIRWDATDIAGLPARALHERVAVVMQDPVEWPMTVADNIRMGRIDRTDPGDAVLHDVAGRSGADEVAADLPRGWDTVLSRAFQNGRDLSGGQWQRVSVARALYRDAHVVVADEPTAAMDARAEQTVFTHLRDLAGDGRDRITVLVTHRLANIRNADVVVVLKDGRVEATGSHDELVALGGEYAELFALQAANYVDTETSDSSADRVPSPRGRLVGS